jgi:hypothetical protein
MKTAMSPHGREPIPLCTSVEMPIGFDSLLDIKRQTPLSGRSFLLLAVG